MPPDNEVIVSKPRIEDVEDYCKIASALGLAARLAVEKHRRNSIEELHQLSEACQKRDPADYLKPKPLSPLYRRGRPQREALPSH
jgi:DNA-binding GntR family transcriptional regulator